MCAHAAPLQVIEYCKFHVDAGKKTGEAGAPAVKEDDQKAFDAEFVKVDQGTLFELILVRLGLPRPLRTRDARARAARCAPRAASPLRCALSHRAPPNAVRLRTPLTRHARLSLDGLGGQLPEHQGAAGPDVPDGCQHDQGCVLQVFCAALYMHRAF